MPTIREPQIHPGQVAPLHQGELVYNDSGGDLAAGDLVRVSGWYEQSDISERSIRRVAKADADLADAAAVYVCRTAIKSGKQGRVFKTYRFTGQNTNAGNVNDPVYLSSTAGGWTLTAPSASNARVQIVGRIAVKSSTVGVIEFNLQDQHFTGRLPQAQVQGGATTVTVSITNAEMLALRATPKQLVAAPGAGFMLVFEHIVFSSLASGGAYTETTDNLAVKYTNGSGATASGTIETTGVIDSTSQTYSFAPSVACLPVANAALVLHNIGDGEFGGGNAANTMRAIVTYRTVTLP